MNKKKILHPGVYTRLLFRISLPILLLCVTAVLITYLTTSEQDPILAKYACLEQLEHITVSMVLLVFGALMIRRAESEQQ